MGSVIYCLEKGSVIPVVSSSKDPLLESQEDQKNVGELRKEEETRIGDARMSKG